MDVFSSFTPEVRAEFERLCRLYEEATDKGDIPIARDVRGGISDYIEKVCGADADLETAVRHSLGFPVNPSPLASDQ